MFSKNSEFYVSLCQLACAPGVLAETSSRKKPYTPHEMGHQLMRTVLHMHDSQKFFRIHKFPEGMAHGQQRTRVIFALHKALMDLKHEVVLIEWTANWKNYMKVIKYDHGPLHWVQHDRVQTVRKFSDTEIEKVFQCKVCEGQQNKNLSNTHFFSENHLLTHLRQKMFGCGR